MYPYILHMLDVRAGKKVVNHICSFVHLGDTTFDLVTHLIKQDIYYSSCEDLSKHALPPLLFFPNEETSFPRRSHGYSIQKHISAYRQIPSTFFVRSVPYFLE